MVLRASADLRSLGEQYKAALIRLDELIIKEWVNRILQVDKSEKFRALHLTVLEKTRKKAVDRSAMVTYFRNSVATEWQNIRESYPSEVRQAMRQAVIDETGIDPHLLYMESQKSVLRVIANGQITTTRQFHLVRDFAEGLDAGDEELRRTCQSMLDEYEAAMMKAAAAKKRK